MKHYYNMTLHMSRLSRKMRTALFTCLTLLAITFNSNAQSGAALHFDGSNDFCLSPLFSLATNNITMEGKFYWNGPSTGSKFLFYNGNSGSSGYGLYISSNSNTISYLYGGIATNTTFTISPNVWTSIAMVITSNTLTIYKDGVVAFTGAVGVPNAPTFIYTIGSDYTGGSPFNGAVDEVRFWNVARTQCEINTFMNCEIAGASPGLAANYHFNQGTASGANATQTFVTDASGNGFNCSLNNFALTGTTSNWIAPGGVVSGSTTPLPAPSVAVTSGTITLGQSFTMTPSGGATYTYVPTGPVVTPTANSTYTVLSTAANGCTASAQSTVTILGGAALKFDGTNDFCQSPLFSFATNNITMEGKFLWDGPSAGQKYLFYNGSSVGSGYGLYIDANSNMLYYNFGGVSSASAFTISPNVWTSIAMVLTSNTLTIYKDGVAAFTSTVNTPNIPTFIYTIGSDYTSGKNFNGTIDEVRFWNIARTSCEINTFMNCEIPSSAPGLAANYHFNQGLATVSNPTQTVLLDASGNAANCTLGNFALTGTTSNWVAPGAVPNGYTITTPPPAIAVNSGTIISGQSFTMAPSGGVSYTYVPSGPIVSPTVNSTYTVIGLAASGCTNTAISNVTMRNGEALSFDGTNDFCQSPLFSFATNSITMEGKFFWNGPSSTTKYLFYNGASNGSGYGLFIAPNSNMLNYLYGGISTNSAFTLTPNVWTSIAMVITSNTITIYKDGVLSYTAAAGTPNVPTFIYTIGSDFSSGNNFNGLIDEVRFWNVARTKCEINTYMNCEIPASATGLLANYHFNQGTASGSNTAQSNLIDASGNNNNCSLGNFALTGTVSNWVAPGSVVSGFTTTLPSPTISIASASICSGNSFTLSPIGASTYTFQGGNAVVSPSVTSSYSVVGTASTGCQAVAPVTSTITIYALPTVAVNSGSICAGNSFTISPNGASTYTIQGGNATVSPSVTSSYSVIGTNSLGCVSAVSATSTVTVNARPTVSVNSGAICSGTSFTLSPSGASTYTIQGGNAIVSPSSNSAYTVVGTSTAGCTSATFATSNVTVNAIPTLSVNSGVICSGNSFTLSPSGASTYTIQGGNAIVSPTANTSYSVSGTSSAGCVASVAVTSSVSVNARPTVSVNSGAICSGTSFTLSPSGASTYTIQGGNNIVSPTSNSAYTVVGTSTAGCTSASFATSNVTVNALPTVSVNSGAICSGSSFTISPGGANTYTVQGGNTIVSPTSNSTYTVIGTNSLGCVSAISATSAVTVNNLPTVTVNSGTICSGNSFTISPSGAATYTIQGGNSVVSPTSTSNYSVTGTSTAGCVASVSATSSVVVNALPTVSVNSGTICSGQSFTLAPSGASTYTIQGGTAVLSPTASGTYSVVGTNTLGCNSSVSNATITVNALPTVVVSSNASVICLGETTSLTAAGAASYTWNTSTTTTVIAVSPSVTSSYTVTGTDTKGCKASASITQSVSACTDIAQLTMKNNALNFNVYPNPTNGLISISLSSLDETTHLELRNSIGQLVLTVKPNATELEIDLSEFAKGIYFVRINSMDGVLMKKIIKE